MDEDLQQQIQALQGLSGLNFSFAFLFGSFVFGVIGFYLWRTGRKRVNAKVVWTGVALMVYPIFLTSTWLLWCVGIFLTSLAYYFLEVSE